MKRRHLLAAWVLSCAVLPGSIAPALASNTFYRCTDPAGATLYTNQKIPKGQCTVLSVMQTPANGSATARPGSAAQSSARNPTPSDFPKVAQSEQKARDTDRRSILMAELANERNLLDAARKQNRPDAAALHERNIEALNKEMARLP
jgi:hypothetical protein